jgi:hypothetical protein
MGGQAEAGRGVDGIEDGVQGVRESVTIRAVEEEKHGFGDGQGRHAGCLAETKSSLDGCHALSVRGEDEGSTVISVGGRCRCDEWWRRRGMRIRGDRGRGEGGGNQRGRGVGGGRGWRRGRRRGRRRRGRGGRQENRRCEGDGG